MLLLEELSCALINDGQFITSAYKVDEIIDYLKYENWEVYKTFTVTKVAYEPKKHIEILLKNSQYEGHFTVVSMEEGGCLFVYNKGGSK